MINEVITVIILLGAPGAGKGTVADYLKESYNAVHFSTGNLLRYEVQQKTEIGKKVVKVVSSGGLVPDEIVNEIVATKLPDVFADKKIVLLDGYPRTIEQAKYLDSIVSPDSIRVVEIDISPETVVSRIAKRLICDKCKFTTNSDEVKSRVCPQLQCGGNLVKRADDKDEIVRNRMLEYAKDTLPVSQYYKDNGDRWMEVSGEVPPEEVMREFDRVLLHFGIPKKVKN